MLRRAYCACFGVSALGLEAGSGLLRSRVRFPKSLFLDLEEIWTVVRRYRRVRTDFGGRVDDRRHVGGTSCGWVGRAGGREDGIGDGVGVRFVEAPGGFPPKVPFWT